MYEYQIAQWSDKENRRVISVNADTDTDFAGCRGTRKSTSGGVIIKAWSTTQTVIALSSSEAESSGLFKVAAEAGHQVRDVGYELQDRVGYIYSRRRYCGHWNSP